MHDVHFDRFYRYEDLTRILRGTARIIARHERAGAAEVEVGL